jgi:hypothetical protein
VEQDGIRAVGLADAIADSIEGLGRLKGRILWGPTAIVRDLVPVLLVMVAMTVAVEVLPPPGAAGTLLGIITFITFLWLLCLWQAAKVSWRGLFQGFVYVSFFGPLSVIEAVLAPPTAALLSRLVSRARVHEADARAVELTGDASSLASALRRVEEVELQGESPWMSKRRYSRFVASASRPSRWPWLTRQLATHPSTWSRLETIGSTDPYSSRSWAAGVKKLR